MRKKLLSLLIIFLSLGLFLTVEAVEAAPRLYFDPATGNYDNGSQFSIVVKIDTGTDEAMAADALINFDSSKLSIQSVTTGGFFSGFDYNVDADNGRLTIYSFAEQALQTKSGSGSLATISFSATAEGTAAVSFLCQAGNDVDSAVWDAQGNDLIDCAANGSGSYVIGSSTGTGGETTATSTPVPTTAPDSPTSTPSQLPETGVEMPLLITLIGGGIMLLLGVAIAL